MGIEPVDDFPSTEREERLREEGTGQRSHWQGVRSQREWISQGISKALVKPRLKADETETSDWW